jgi:hypothetical protein
MTGIPTPLLTDDEIFQLASKLLMDLADGVTPRYNADLHEEDYYQGRTAFYWVGYLSDKLLRMKERCK